MRHALHLLPAPKFMRHNISIPRKTRHSNTAQQPTILHMLERNRKGGDEINELSTIPFEMV
jgi:hypothetical protein